MSQPNLIELHNIEKQLTQFIAVCNKTGYPTDISESIKKLQAYIDIIQRLRCEENMLYPDFLRIEGLIQRFKEIGAP